MGNVVRQKIGPYQIQGLVRSDNIFSLYRAVYDQTGKSCFLEILFPGKIYSEEFINHFLDRADLLSVIEHPHLLNVVDSGYENGLCYIVFEDFEGNFLSSFNNPPHIEIEIARLLVQVAEGLAFLHEQQIIHGILSPENVIVGADGSAKIINFGLSDLVAQEAAAMLPENAVGIGCGMPGFLAPEQILGQTSSVAVDVFAIGALYFWLFMKQPPYRGETLIETALRQIASNFVWPIGQERYPTTTSIRFIHRCLARFPEDRFTRMAEVESILNEIATGKRPYIRIKRSLLKNAPPKNRWPWLALTAIAIALAGSWFWISSNRLVGSSISATTTAFQPSTYPSKTPLPTPTLPENLPQAAGLPIDNGISNPISTPALKLPVLINTPFPEKLEQISIENASEIKEIARLGGGKRIQAAWAPDKKTIAIASTSGVNIFESGEIIQFIDPEDAATSVTFSVDGDILAVGTEHGDIQLWDWKTPEKKMTLKGHTARVSRILFTSNRRFLISASYDLHIKTWNLNEGSEWKDIPAHPLPVKDISLSKDGRFLVSGAGDQMVKVWDTSTGKKITEFRHSSAVQAVAISPDGTYVAAGGPSGEINEWNIQTRQLRGNPGRVRYSIWSLFYDENNNSLWIGTDNGVAGSWVNNKLINKQEQLRLKDIYGADFEFSSDLAISPDFQNYLWINWDGELSENIKELKMLVYDDFHRLAFSPDSKYLLVGGKNNFYFLLNTYSNTIIYTGNLTVPLGNPFSPDSNNFILTQKTYSYSELKNPIYSESISLYPISSKNIMYLGEPPLNSSVQFVKDGSLIVAGTMAKTQMWDTASANEVYLKEGLDSGCRVVRSANTGEILSITSLLGLLTEWDEVTQNLCSLSAQYSEVAVFSSNRKWYAFINPNGLLEVTNLEANQTTLKISLDHKLSTMAFSPDGSLLLTGFKDGSLSIRSTANESVQQNLPGHFGSVSAVTFSPDGKMAVSGSFDGTIRIWGVLQK